MGIEWLFDKLRDDGAPRSVIGFPRKGPGGETLLFVANMNSVLRENYDIGVPAEDTWREILNSYARDYGGSGWGGLGALETLPVPHHGRPYSLVLTLPALGPVFLERETSP